MQNNKVKNIFFIEDDTENYKTGLYLEMEDWRKFANCSTDCIIPFKLIDDIPQKSSQSSEDKQSKNKQDFCKCNVPIMQWFDWICKKCNKQWKSYTR